MAFIIPRDTATFSAPETASFDVDEAGVISDEAPEERSEEEPSTFKIDMFLTGGHNLVETWVGSCWIGAVSLPKAIHAPDHVQ